MPLVPSIPLIRVSASELAETTMPDQLVTAFGAVAIREAGDLPEVRQTAADHRLPTRESHSTNFVMSMRLSQPALPGSSACPSAANLERSQSGPSIPPVRFLNGEHFRVFQKCPPIQTSRSDDAPPPPRAVRDCFVIHDKELKFQQLCREEKSPWDHHKL